MRSGFSAADHRDELTQTYRALQSFILLWNKVRTYPRLHGTSTLHVSRLIRTLTKLCQINHLRSRYLRAMRWNTKQHRRMRHLGCTHNHNQACMESYHGQPTHQRNRPRL
jgi:hypothetical protein